MEETISALEVVEILQNLSLFHKKGNAWRNGSAIIAAMQQNPVQFLEWPVHFVKKATFLMSN